MSTKSVLLWWIPMLGFSTDALAWGLVTHVYFAQLLLWSVPLLDPRLRAAARRLPELVLAGACLPDLMLTGPRAGTLAFRGSHRWEAAQRLVTQAAQDEERALAVGYASHLYVDIVAHNHFVPVHERLWIKLPMLTHAAVEWAMDAHVDAQLFASPQYLLRTHLYRIADYVAQAFECPTPQALQSVRLLGRGVSVLYGMRMHHALYQVARRWDRALPARFDAYAAEVTSRLPGLNRLLRGETPLWPADAPCPERVQHLDWMSPAQLRAPLPIPLNLYA